jgi:hypothetical protein
MGRTDLDSTGRWYAKVLLQEPMPAPLRRSLEHFATGTGSLSLIWPSESKGLQENQIGPNGQRFVKKSGVPQAAFIAYATDIERQAALEENQCRPGEWGFYAAASNGPRESKDRRASRGEGEEVIREPFSELQPPQIGRSGLLGDAPQSWQLPDWPEQSMGESWGQEVPWNTSAEPWEPSWPSWRNRDEGFEFYVDPEENTERPEPVAWQPGQQGPVGQVPLSTPPMPFTLPAAEELVRPEDVMDSSTDMEEAEYRRMVMCLPSGIVDMAGSFDDDELPSKHATPVRGKRAQPPSTPGSAAAVALWRPLQNGLPCRHTFIHFEHREQVTDSYGSSRRARSCPIKPGLAALAPTPHPLLRAFTMDETKPTCADLPAADQLPDLEGGQQSPQRPARQPVASMLETPIRKELETPVRRDHGLPEDDSTPAPRSATRVRRGVRGRGSRDKKTWRPTLWADDVRPTF